MKIIVLCMKLIVSSSVFCTVHTFFYRDLVVGINTLIVAMQTFLSNSLSIVFGSVKVTKGTLGFFREKITSFFCVTVVVLD